jgi:hypothetical protein
MVIILQLYGGAQCFTMVFNSLAACQSAANAIKTKKNYLPEMYAFEQSTGIVTIL